MFHLITGELPIAYLKYRDFKKLERSILELNNGDIFFYDGDPKNFPELVNQISGWNAVNILTDEEINLIKENTSIEFSNEKA